MPVGIGEQGGDGRHGVVFGGQGDGDVVDHALQLEVVAQFLLLFAQLLQVVGRDHAQTGMGALQGGGGLAHETGMVQTEPVEGVAVGVGAVMYGFVAGAEGSQSLYERGVALQNLLHVQSS